MPESASVLYELADGVATITLNRPEAMNSLTGECKEELLTAVNRARDDSGARAVLLTARGTAFCVGQDLREHAETLSSDEESAGTVRTHYNPIARALAQMPKPVIAAVNGVAAGAGAAFAFACDLRVVSDQARFLLAFANVGLGPDSGASWTLPRLVGRARAMELLLLAEPIDAERALDIGLATEVVPAERLGERANELATRLAKGPTVSYAAIKGELNFGSGLDLENALEMEASLQEQCMQTADHLNATLAFVNKERPTFEGR